MTIDQDGSVEGPFYVFSISNAALDLQPWRTGTVYLLPNETFEAQAPMPFGPRAVQSAQLASASLVPPVARLTVAPDDFPFLNHIRGHDVLGLPSCSSRTDRRTLAR